MKKGLALFIAFSVLSSVSFGASKIKEVEGFTEEELEEIREYELNGTNYDAITDYVYELEFEISDKKILSQSESNAVVSFNITNPTDEYYPELYYIPSLCFSPEEQENLGRMGQYMTYAPVKFTLGAKETKVITYDLTFPSRLPNMEYAVGFDFYSKEYVLSDSREYIFLKEINSSYSGFLEPVEDVIFMIGDNEYLMDQGPNLEGEEIPTGVIKVKSTFNEDKMVIPEFKVYRRSRVSNNTPISVTYGSSLIIKKNEVKEIKLELPKMYEPESYLIETTFIDENMRRVSEQYDFRYVVKGAATNIGNILAKQVGNNIEVTASLLGTVDNSTIKGADVVCEIYNNNNLIAKKEVETDIKSEFYDVNLVLENIDVSTLSKVTTIVKVLYEGEEIATKSQELDLEFTDPNRVVLKDIKGTKYEEAVTVLNSLGILNGYPDGTFKPGNTITRAEFATIATKLGELEIEKNAVSKFYDVVEEHWAKPYINACSENNIVAGYNDGTFKPENNVKYSEAITILLNILGYKAEVNSGFLGWPDNYLTKSIELGIHNPADYSDISAAATRGDIAILTYNAYLRR